MEIDSTRIEKDPNRALAREFVALAMRMRVRQTEEPKVLELLEDEEFRKTLSQTYQAAGDELWRIGYVNAYRLAAACEILDRPVPDEVLDILRSPKEDENPWSTSNISRIAAARMGWTDERHSPDDEARLKSRDWGLGPSLLGAAIEGSDFRGVDRQLVQIMVGLGWRTAAFVTPDPSLFVPLLPRDRDDAWWAKVSPSESWWDAHPKEDFRFVDHEIENHARGVQFHIRSMTSDFPHVDQAIAITLVHMGESLQHEAHRVFSNIRSWDSWQRKFNDPKKGLWIRTQTEQAIDDLEPGWREFATICLGYLARLVATRFESSTPRVRWVVGDQVVVDVDASGNS